MGLLILTLEESFFSEDRLLLRKSYSQFEKDPHQLSVVLDMECLLCIILSRFYALLLEYEVERKPSRNLMLSYWNAVRCTILFRTVQIFAGLAMQLLLIQ